MQYLIDGYNVIHHSAILKPLLDTHFEAARDALVDKVAQFCSVSGHRARIVFDGRGQKGASGMDLPGAPGLDVFFSADGQSADAVIERLVYASSSRRDTIVVTSDRGIRGLCMGLGAFTMEPDNFLVDAREVQSRLFEHLDRSRREDPPQRVQDRLDDATLEHLRQLRGELAE
ncbi:MAG: uncharacterized protein QG656_407 [Candidatus Hydrogenedentes bacterium]|nr:uncharacterized protein [Candidatus Hydrogenedentota bacterium]